VFIAFTYFIFVSSREHLVTNVVIGIVAVLVLLDVLFFVFVPRTWLTEDANNSIWNSLKSMHGFAIFCSVIVLLLKVRHCLCSFPCFGSSGIIERKLKSWLWLDIDLFL
jgi:hypothetical protein